MILFLSLAYTRCSLGCLSWKKFVKFERNLKVYLRAAITNYNKLCNLKQHKLIVSQFWRLEVQNQVVRMPMLSLKPVTRNSFLPFPSFWWLPAIYQMPWPVALALQYSVLTGCSLSVCLCPLLKRTPVITFEAISHCHPWNPRSRWAGHIRTQFDG